MVNPAEVNLSDKFTSANQVKNKTINFEIVTSSNNEYLLKNFQNIYGGSIKKRSNFNSVRYRLYYVPKLLELIKDIKNKIYNSNRLIEINNILEIIARENNNLKINQANAPKDSFSYPNSNLSPILNDLTLYSDFDMARTRENNTKNTFPGFKNGWFAGFFDSQGSIEIIDSNITISISQTNKDLLSYIHKYFGGKIISIKGNKKSFK